MHLKKNGRVSFSWSSKRILNCYEAKNIYVKITQNTSLPRVDCLAPMVLWLSSFLHMVPSHLTHWDIHHDMSREQVKKLSFFSKIWQHSLEVKSRTKASDFCPSLLSSVPRSFSRGHIIFCTHRKGHREPQHLEQVTNLKRNLKC